MLAKYVANKSLYHYNIGYKKSTRNISRADTSWFPTKTVTRTWLSNDIHAQIYSGTVHDNAIFNRAIYSNIDSRGLIQYTYTILPV